jgi:hypothetical protein
MTVILPPLVFPAYTNPNIKPVCKVGPAGLIHKTCLSPVQACRRGSSPVVSVINKFTLVIYVEAL